MMKVDKKLIWFGPSAGIILPKSWLDSNQLRPGDVVRVSINKDVRISVVKRQSNGKAN